ncbi:MAG: hypothetical protein JRN15_05250 [Nitrososphaerota archaeon]|nr:hypothetical protein [Nitrososphaerota archaeon]
MTKLAWLLFVILLLLVVPFKASASSASNSFNIRVYSDGSTSILQSLTVNSSTVSITVPLLTPVITDVLVTDQNGSPLSFQISSANITVYTIGATEANIRYTTDALTSKQGSVWTLTFATSYNLTLTLPQNSTLSSVSNTPISISVANGFPVVAVSPGNWTIKYGVPLQAVSTTNNISVSSSSTLNGQSSSNQQTGTQTQTTVSKSSSSSTPRSSNSLSLEYGLAVVVAALLSTGGYVFFKWRSTASKNVGETELRPDDSQVLDFISEKGGKVFEQEIRSKFTLPKTSTWRQIKRLERLGYVRVVKIGSQNQIELLKKRE